MWLDCSVGDMVQVYPVEPSAVMGMYLHCPIWKPHMTVKCLFPSSVPSVTQDLNFHLYYTLINVSLVSCWWLAASNSAAQTQFQSHGRSGEW
jgi:hypothetical protein